MSTTTYFWYVCRLTYARKAGMLIIENIVNNKATIHLTSGHDPGNLGKRFTALAGLDSTLFKIQPPPIH